MKAVKNVIKTLLVISSVALIVNSCGGGGGGGSSTTPPTTGGGNTQSMTKSFTVSLASIEIRRVSNDGRVEVDTADISSSGTLAFNQ